MPWRPAPEVSLRCYLRLALVLVLDARPEVLAFRALPEAFARPVLLVFLAVVFLALPEVFFFFAGRLARDFLGAFPGVGVTARLGLAGGVDGCPAAAACGGIGPFIQKASSCTRDPPGFHPSSGLNI